MQAQKNLKKIENVVDFDFEFTNQACEFVLEEVHEVPGEEPVRVIKACPDTSKTYRFKYQDSKGLQKFDENGSKGNVLANFLKTDFSYKRQASEFFSSYGYLINLPEGTYTTIDIRCLLLAQQKLSCIVDIINNLDGDRDYWSLFESTACLMLMNPLFETDASIIKQTEMSNLISNEVAIEDRQSFFFNGEELTVVDHTGLKPLVITHREIACMEEGFEVEGIKGSSTFLYRKLFDLYTNFRKFRSNDTLEIIDFFFRFMHDYEVIAVTQEGVEYYTDIHKEEFPQILREALLRVAKIALSMEINANITGIYPQYDYSRLTPLWKIDSLLSAMYFSVFYMNPGTKHFAKCKNPNCKGDGYFIKNGSDTRKLFCCDRCRNAANQQKYRTRLKEY